MFVVCHSLLSCLSAAAVTFLQRQTQIYTVKATVLDRPGPLTAMQLRTLRVTVAHADGSHTGKQVQVSLPVHVPQPLHVTLVDEYRFLIVGDSHGHGEAILLSDLQHSLFGHSLDREDTQDGKTATRMGRQIFTLNSSGLKSHGGISGMSVVGVLKADF